MEEVRPAPSYPPAAALLVRCVLSTQLPFPQLDDPAGYIQLARNIAAGRGLVSDVLWNYWVSFPGVTHPSNEFWMPLASVLMAGSQPSSSASPLAQVQIPAPIGNELQKLLVPGTLVITTPGSLTPEKRSVSDFVGVQASALPPAKRPQRVSFAPRSSAEA